METIKERLDRDFLLGIIKYKGAYMVYLMPVVYWVLNHKKYNPYYNSKETNFVFRKNVLNVADDQIDNFIDAIHDDEISLNELKQILTNDIASYDQLNFFVDFDKKEFVSAFPDIEIEGYLPNDDWKGIFNNPINYLPEDMKLYLSR